MDKNESERRILMKKMKKSKQLGGPSVFEKGSNIPIDKVSGMEGSPTHESAETGDMEHAEPPSEHELDMHYETLMKAEAVKGNGNIMKHLGPHMEKKKGHIKKITSIAELKRVAKQKAMEE
jgi:hypothetical protein